MGRRTKLVIAVALGPGSRSVEVGRDNRGVIIAGDHNTITQPPGS